MVWDLQITTRSEAHTELNRLRRKSDSVLVISGDSLQVNRAAGSPSPSRTAIMYSLPPSLHSLSLQLCLSHYELEFIELACQCPAVVCCRCSPTHKAQVVSLLRTHTKRPICAIGAQLAFVGSVHFIFIFISSPFFYSLSLLLSSLLIFLCFFPSIFPSHRHSLLRVCWE